MAEQLQRWLRDEVQLSRAVDDFEREFANGYLIAEVLAKHNQLPGFSPDAFHDDDRSDTKISNFTRVEPVLRRMGIRFDARRASSIMAGHRDSAKTLLYEIRVAAAPLNKVSVSMRPPPNGGVKAARLGLRSSAPEYDAAQSKLFAKSIRVKAENQNEIFLKKHMRNFGRGVERLWAQRDAIGRARQDAHKAALNQQRLRQLHMLRTNRMLRAAKEEHGVREWQRNMEVRLAQTQRARRLARDAQAAKREAAALDAEQGARDLAEGTAQFEAAAERLGVETEAGGKEYEGKDEAADLILAAKASSSSASSSSSLAPLAATQGLSREEYFEALEARLGTQEAAQASASAILRRLRRRKKDKDELMDKRKRRRAAFVSAGSTLRATRLEAERRQWLASSLRARSRAEASVDDACAAVERLEGGMRLRRAKEDEDRALARMRAEAAALRWDADLWHGATEAHASDAVGVIRRLAQLRAERAASKREAVEALCRKEAHSLVEAALAMAEFREQASQLGRHGHGWEAVVEGKAGESSHEAKPWEGTLGLPARLWDRLRLCLTNGASPWLALPPAGSEQLALVSASTGAGSDATAGEPAAHRRPRGTIVWEGAGRLRGPAGVRSSLLGALFETWASGGSEWAGLQDQSAAAKELDAAVRDAIATEGGADAELGAGSKESKKAKKKKDPKKGKDGDGEGDDESARLLPVTSTKLLIELLGLARPLPAALLVGEGETDEEEAGSGGEASDRDVDGEGRAGSSSAGEDGNGTEAALSPEAVLGRMVAELRRSAREPERPPHPGRGVPWSLPLRSALLGPPFAPLDSLGRRLASAFGLRTIDPWLLLVEARSLAIASRRQEQEREDGQGKGRVSSITISAVDDVAAGGETAPAGSGLEGDGDPTSSFEAKLRLVGEGQEQNGLGSPGPVGRDKAFADRLAGGDRLLALAAENTDGFGAGHLQHALGLEQGGQDSSLGAEWHDDMVQLGSWVLRDESAGDDSGHSEGLDGHPQPQDGEEDGSRRARARLAAARWWMPSTESLVGAVHLALRKLTSDIVAASNGKANQGAETEWSEDLRPAAESLGLHGWLLIGFPRTAEQASALEALLTGWRPDPPAESAWVAAASTPAHTKQWDEAVAPVPAEAQPDEPSKAYRPSQPRGLRAVLRISTDSLRAARYALGWRADSMAVAMASPKAGLPHAARTSLIMDAFDEGRAPSEGPDATTAVPTKPAASGDRAVARSDAEAVSSAIREAEGETKDEEDDDGAEARSAAEGDREPEQVDEGDEAPPKADGEAGEEVQEPDASRDGHEHETPSARDDGEAGVAATDVSADEEGRDTLAVPAASARESPVPSLPLGGAGADHPRASLAVKSVREEPSALPRLPSGRLSYGAAQAAGDMPAGLSWTAREARAAEAPQGVQDAERAALAGGYVPTLRKGQPLFHVDLLPPAYALPSKGQLRRTPIAAAASVRMPDALAMREAAGCDDALDAWFERSGVLRVMRWHRPKAEERAREEVAADPSPVAPSKARLRVEAALASLDGEHASAAEARALDESRPEPDGAWAVVVNRAGSEVSQSRAWAEFQPAPAAQPCSWAVVGRDFLQDQELFVCAARSFAHAFATADASDRIRSLAAEERAEVAGRVLNGLREAAMREVAEREGLPVLRDEASKDAASHTAGFLQPPPLPGAIIGRGRDSLSQDSKAGVLDDTEHSLGGTPEGADQEVEGIAGHDGAEAAAADGTGSSPLPSSEQEQEQELEPGSSPAAAAAAAASSSAGDEAGDGANDDSPTKRLAQLQNLLQRAREPTDSFVALIASPFTACDRVSASMVSLAASCADSSCRRWDGAVSTYGQAIEAHADRWQAELDAAIRRCGGVTAAFERAMGRHFDGYSQALASLQARLDAVPAEARRMEATKQALLKDCDAVITGMQDLAGQRFAHAQAAAGALQRDGWLETVRWSLLRSFAGLLSAETRKMMEVRRVALVYSCLAGGAVPLGVAPLEAEAAHLLHIARTVLGAEFSSLADVVSYGEEGGDDDAGDDAAPHASGHGKKKGDGKKKQGKGGSSGGDADDLESKDVGSAGVGSEAALAFARELGLLAGAPSLQEEGRWALPSAPADAHADAPATDDGEVRAAAESAAASSGEEGLEEWLTGHWASLCRVAAARTVLAAASSGDASAQPLAVPAPLLDGSDAQDDTLTLRAPTLPRPSLSAVESLLAPTGARSSDNSGAAASSSAGAGASASKDDGGSEADAPPTPLMSTLAGLTARAHDRAAAVAWDGGRLVRAGERIGNALRGAEALRSAAAGAIEAAIAQAEEEAREAVAEHAEAEESGGKKKADKKKADKKGGVELPDLSQVAGPLKRVLPMTEITALAKATAGTLLEEASTMRLAEQSVQPFRNGKKLLRELAAARAGACIRAQGRLSEPVAKALQHEARKSAARFRALQRAAARSFAWLDRLAAHTLAGARACAQERLEAELSAIAAAREALGRSVIAGEPMRWPLRIQVRCTPPEARVTRRFGAGGSATALAESASTPVPARVEALCVESRTGQPLRAASAMLAGTSASLETLDPNTVSPSGVSLLVSALRAVAEEAGNRRISSVSRAARPAVAEGEEEHKEQDDEDALGLGAWHVGFVDSPRVRIVEFGPDGAPVPPADKAQPAQQTSSTPAHPGESFSGQSWTSNRGATLVPAGAWIPAAACASTLHRLAAAGKLGALWQQASRDEKGTAFDAVVRRCHVNARVWGGSSEGAVEGHPVEGWVDWRLLCTAILCGAGPDGGMPARTTDTAVAVADGDASSAVVALSRPRLAGRVGVVPGLPSKEALGAARARFETLAASGEEEGSIPAEACKDVRFWFDEGCLLAVANHNEASRRAEQVLADATASRGSGVDADSSRLAEAAARGGDEASASDPRLRDGLGGWHQLPQPHPAKASLLAERQSKAREQRQRLLVEQAEAARAAAEADAAASADAGAMSLTRSLLRIWTDSTGMVRWQQMLQALDSMEQ